MRRVQESKSICVGNDKEMGNRVTIIVGAGAVLDFDHKGIFPSVKNITDEVLKLSIQKVDGGERPLLRELYDYIVGKLNQVGRPEVNRYIPPQLNFESLLHVVEMCISYSGYWHKEFTSWPALPEFGTTTSGLHMDCKKL